MTTTNILAINFIKENITDSKKDEFMTAVCHENTLMTIQDMEASILRLETKAANVKGNYSEEEVAAFNAQLKDMKESLEKLTISSQETQEVYEKVVASMSRKNENGFGNDKDVVRTVLRVLATWNNSKLAKYAIIPAFDAPDLYYALEEIHINSEAGDNGNIVMSKAVKEAYKKASDELERIIKVTFSLPFETEYTEKTRVKMTAQDKKTMNDCYVRGIKNTFSQDDETGVVDFKKQNKTTLVKAKKNKKTGETTYDYSGLAKTICDIVMPHYFQK